MYEFKEKCFYNVISVFQNAVAFSNPRLKKAEEIIKKSFPEEYSLKQLHALPKALRSRCSKRPRTGSFQDKIYLDAAYKFSDSCMTELTGHTGCVNALGWSSDDQFIVSGSDDKCINLYNALGKDRTPRSRFFTGHQSNIFQELVFYSKIINF